MVEWNTDPTAPWHDMTSQIIWLGRCFIVATTYFWSKCLPNGQPICMQRGTNCCMVHLSENNTFFHSARLIAMTSGLDQCLFLHHWGQVRSECLTCTFRESCCRARLSRAQVPAFVGSSVQERILHHWCRVFCTGLWEFSQNSLLRSLY